MKPYYEENGIVIYHGDNMTVLPALDACSIDMTVTSPPYGNLRKYNGYVYNFEGVAQELYRVTKDGGVVVWVEGDETINGSESGDSFRHALYFKDKCGFNLHDTMIYKKSGFPFPESTRYNPVFEYMFVLSKGKPKTVNLIADKRNLYAGSLVARLHSDRQRNGIVTENSAYRNNKSKEVKQFGVRDNIWEYAQGLGNTTNDAFAFQHPAMFPEALANDHIRSWSNPGDTILDCFMGSNTTGKMARKNGCKFIGIEISEAYCEIAANRLRQEVFNFEGEL